MKAKLYTDGGSRGNPGPSGIGYVLLKAGKEPIEGSEYIGQATNNQAEYEALIRGLTRAIDEKVSEIVCYLDSELVVKQLKGEYRVKEAGLKKLFVRVGDLKNKFTLVQFLHVPREKNKRADWLVNKALDKKR